MAIIKIWEKSEEHTQPSPKAMAGTASVKTFNVDKKYCLNKNKISDNITSIELNNKTFTISDKNIVDRNIFLKINNQRYKAKILNKDNNSIEIYIFNFNKSFKFLLKQPLKINAAKLIKDDSNFNKELICPLAGRVVSIHVQENVFIKKNQVLLTIESMKMENEIRASSDCFIKTIQISQSDLVKPNQVLMIFTKKGECSAKSKKEYEQKEISNRRTF